MIDVVAIKARYDALAPHLDERARRLFAASEARAGGRGGVTAVSEATGVARSTIGGGLAELGGDDARLTGRIRRPGGGRKPMTATEPTIPVHAAWKCGPADCSIVRSIATASRHTPVCAHALRRAQPNEAPATTVATDWPPARYPRRALRPAPLFID